MSAARAFALLLRRQGALAPRTFRAPGRLASSSRTIASVSGTRGGALAAGATAWKEIIPRRSVLVGTAPVTRAYSQGADGGSKIWSFEEVKKLTQDPDSEVVIVDTREPSELSATGYIPGAINIPVSSAPDAFFLPDEEFTDRFGEARPPKDAELVFYCKAGVRSRAAARLAREAGWGNVGEYPGSWLDWAENGGEVGR